MDNRIKELCRYFNGILSFRDYIEIPEDPVVSYAKKSTSNRSINRRHAKDAMSFYLSQEEFLSGNILIDDTNESDALLTSTQKDYRLTVIKNWVLKSDGLRSSSDSEEDLIDVVLIPKIVRVRIERNPERSQLHQSDDLSSKKWRPNNIKDVSLLYIKAHYNPTTGQLIPAKGESIIWAHPLLEDSCQQSDIEVSDCNLSLFDFNISDGELENKDEWEEYTSMVETHFYKSTGQPLFASDYLMDSQGKKHCTYKDSHKGEILIMFDDSVLASHNIMRLYESIAKCDGRVATLFQTMAGGYDTPHGYLKKILDGFQISTPQSKIFQYRVGENLSRHMGQMKREFPLADAQRQVVHAVTEMHDGQVLSVSGPPGTGKTTVLQSVVAQLLVDHTLNMITRKDLTSVSPLKIIASSANNQAITNIIDAFAESYDSKSSKTLYTRWVRYQSEGGRKLQNLKYVPMATYFPSNNKIEEAKCKYFISDTKGGIHYDAVKRYFIQKPFVFVSVAMKSLDLYFYEEDPKKAISKILTYLCKRILEATSCFDTLVHLSKIPTTSIDEIQKVLSNCGYSVTDILSPNEGERVEVYIDKLLDKTLRYELYWLSVHYNECLWMQQILKRNKDSTESSDASESKEQLSGKALFDELCFLSPCIVATFYSVPKLFLHKSDDLLKDTKFDFNTADLLIVDESGQVSPEIGFATFALARKAIVVGDVHQIPPVKSLSKYYTDRIWNQYVSTPSMCKQREMFTSSKSSIMSVAMARSCFDRADNAQGLFLNEHRRCVDQIIKYCNDLIYKGELTPKRGRASKLCKLSNLPPMSIYNTRNFCQSKNGSRYNYRDAMEIAKWLEANEDAICNAYNINDKRPQLNQLVVIITPFRAQSEQISNQPFIRNNNIRVGTVHTFQGAESPIVIFSLTYGAKDTPGFVRDNIELMNVAVSRAKDHFIVFGSKYCLQKNTEIKSCELLINMCTELLYKTL